MFGLEFDPGESVEDNIYELFKSTYCGLNSVNKCRKDQYLRDH